DLGALASSTSLSKTSRHPNPPFAPRPPPPRHTGYNKHKARPAMSTPQRQISPKRKRLYYIGMALLILGLLLFLSSFVTFLINFGNFDDFEARAGSGGFRGMGGIALRVLGVFL